MNILGWRNKSIRPPVIDIASPLHKADPFPFYERLRADEPVKAFRLREGQSAWLLTRYDDVTAALKDERLVKNKHAVLTPSQRREHVWTPALFRPLLRNMLDVDPPDHTRLRSLVQKAFTPRLVEQMRPRVEALATSMLDQAIPGGKFDLIESYALPIPTTIIADMLGVPAADQQRFHRWSTTIVTTPPSSLGMLRAMPAVWQFLRYIRRFVQLRRAEPQADLTSALVRVEEAGGTLSEDELVAMIFLLLVAGHETTVNLIGNGVLALLDHPEQFDRLRSDPGLIEPAVEEMLRFASPVETATERYAREDISLAGKAIPRGSLVFAAIASANRDEQVFPDPNQLDITRDPNRHLSFGLGPHYCLGAALARLEAQVALQRLVQCTKTIELAIPRQEVVWRRSLVLRGVKSLPVRVTQ
jgi:cytochrome P450